MPPLALVLASDIHQRHWARTPRVAVVEQARRTVGLQPGLEAGEAGEEGALVDDVAGDEVIGVAALVVGHQDRAGPVAAHHLGHAGLRLLSDLKEAVLEGEVLACLGADDPRRRFGLGRSRLRGAPGALSRPHHVLQVRPCDQLNQL